MAEDREHTCANTLREFQSENQGQVSVCQKLSSLECMDARKARTFSKQYDTGLSVPPYKLSHQSSKYPTYIGRAKKPRV
jgi:hypothetical protein